MRVLLVCPTHFSAKSVLAGAERYSFELAKAMARHTPTTLVTFGDESFESNDGPLRIRCYRRWLYVKNNMMNPFTPAFLGEVLAADVVHCLQYATVVSDLAIMLGALARKRVFVTDLAGATSFSFWYRLKLWRAVRKFLLISEYNRSLMDHIVRPKEIIFGGVDVETFRSTPTEPKKTVLFVGRLMPHKGVEVLLRALDPDMSALIVGQALSPDYAATLRTAAAGKQVEFREDCQDTELLREYRRAWVVALPSTQDGGYTTALEAMACGIPVIGTSVGSLPELIADGKTGFIVPPNDSEALRAKLRLLATDGSLAARMGAAGRARVEQMFTWDHVVQRCMRHYDV